MNFYRKAILQFLKPMQKGYLRITLPEGTVMEFGDPANGYHAEATISSDRFFRRAFLYGDIGFAEAYIAGEWSTGNLTDLLSWFLLNYEKSPTISGSRAKAGVLNLFQFINRLFHLRRKNSLHGSKKNISDHYDLSNEFFSLFLDKTMTYSSAYFTTPDLILEEAQHAKYESLCRSLKLLPTDHLLEIGTGWGGFAVYAAAHYKCRITTVTISEQQYQFARERIRKAGVENLVQVELKDYRLIGGNYDKVVSIEMIEAVGAKYLATYFDKIQSVLKPEGVLALQAIVCPDSRFELLKKKVDFIQKHIFPGSLLPSISAINHAISETGDLFMFSLKDLGRSYVRTLAEWRSRFNQNREHIRQLGFDEEFIRKWNYYFSYCEAAFHMRNINVVQLVYTRPNNHTY
jgi:cyclopropane-fatty-acyl-phospholipid synthase